MEMDYYIDERYLYDTERCEQQLDFGQRVVQRTNAKPYFVQRWDTPGHPLHMCPQFQHPEFFFWADADKGKLRLLYPRLELDIRQEWSHIQQQKIFNMLGNLWTDELLHNIYYYLCEQPFSEYYHALQAFKWAAHLWTFPLCERYDRIQLIDGKLFGSLPQVKSKTTQFSHYLLTEEIISREIRRCGGINEVSHRKKTDLTKCLVRLHQDDPYAEKGSWEKNLAARYREGMLEYIPTMAAARFSEEQPTDVPLALSLGEPLPKDLQCSKSLEHTLSTLTGSDLDKLELLAELFARVFCSTVPSEHLWYIHGNSAAFARWLDQLTEGRTDHTLYSSSRDQFETYIIYDQFLRFLIQWNRSPLTTEAFANLNHTQLGRYMKGDSEIIEIDDPYQTEKTAAYTPAVLFLAEGDRIDAVKAFKKLPVKKLHIPDNWSIPALPLADIQWLKTCFVARGLQIVQDLDRRREQEGQTGLEQVVRQFAANFCETGPDSRTDCKTFYAALKDYIAALPYEVDLKGSTITNRLIETWLGWKRIEDRKNKNRLAFEGVQLNRDKLNAAITEAQEKKEQRKQERAARDFHEYLAETSSLVLWPSNYP